MSNPETIAQIADTPMPGTPGHVLRVRLVKNPAGPQLDMRVFTPFTPAMALMPTGRGLSVPVSLLSSLTTAMEAAETHAAEMGLIERGDA